MKLTYHCIPKIKSIMRKILLMLTMAVLVCSFVGAQSRTVTGKIMDDKDNPLAGVSVVVKGTKGGTTTNSDGHFSLNIPSTTKQLEVSSLGFKQQTVNIGSSNFYTLKMEAGSTSLDEVVITGYGSEKKSQFSGAATTLSSKVIEDVPVGSFTQALQGRAPGLLVNSGSGQPGSNATLTIRGIKSLQGAGAQPLYVIDGVPMDPSNIQTLNPDDFESMTILKDAGAAALYGARGATGVIVIQTKKGKTGATKVTLNTQYGFTQAPDFSRLNMMNTAEILEYEQRLGLAGVNPSVPGWNWSKQNPTYATSTPAVQAERDRLLDSTRKNNANFRDLFYQQGISQSYDATVSGGSDKTKFYISGGYFDQQGTAIGSGLERFTTRINLDHTSNKFSVMWNTAIGYSISDFSEGERLGNSSRNPFQMTYRAKPYENPFNADGTLNFGTSTSSSLKTVANLMEGVQNSSYKEKKLKITSSIVTAYKLFSFLTAKNTLGIDATSNLSQRYIRPDSYVGTLQGYGATYPGYDGEDYEMNSQLINTSSLIFGKKYDKHDVEVGAYFEVVKTNYKGIGFSAYNLDPRLLFTAQGRGPLPTDGKPTFNQPGYSSMSSTGIRSYFATGRYTYDNKYTLNANIRHDGTSRIFSEKNKEITTWSAGLIWNAIQENFMLNQNVLTDMKLRVSYGMVPNIGSIPNRNSQVAAYGSGSYVGSTISGIVPTSPGNPNLKIEFVKKSNIGMDLATWNNRASFSVDAYYEETVDLFVRQPLSYTSGFEFLPINAGIMTNKGLEFSLSVDVVKTKDVLIKFGANHAININNIKDLGVVNEYPAATFIIRKGLPYGSHYNVHYLGADVQTGRPTYEKLDGTITTNISEAGKFAKYGTYLPKHVGGFTAAIQYKRFSIDALFSYQFDVVRSDNTRNWITRGTSGYQSSVNGSRELLTRQWQKPGDIAWFQSPKYDRDFTSADLADAKFLRFRNLNVSYQIPGFGVKGVPVIKGATFYVQMQNLAIWSPWTGLDPEDNNNISLYEYPNPKMIVTGLKINLQ